MMLGLLGEILGLVVSVSSSQDAFDGALGKDRMAIGLNISVGVGTPNTTEGAKYDNMPRHRFEGIEPAIDVAETKDTVRIIINFPGIKEEDVQFNAKSGVLEVVVAKNGHLFRKEVRCDVKEESVLTKSSTLNNSVLDVTLSKN